MLLIIGLAFSAAALAAVGVYGLVTYAVTRRTVEIGVRAALGAQPAQTFRLVVMAALKLVILGVAASDGRGGARRSLESLLFGVSAFDIQSLRGGRSRRDCRRPGRGHVARDARVPDRSRACTAPGVALRYGRATIAC
jgi:hypothetical protein